MKNINPALAWRRRVLAEQAEAKKTEQAEQDVKEMAPLEMPRKPGRTGVATLDWRRQKEYEAACKRIEAQRAKQAEAKMQAVTAKIEGHEQLLTELADDIQRLRELPVGEARIAMIDNDLIPVWEPHVQAYIEAGECYPNAILVQLMIWLFDAGHLEQALELADLAIAQHQEMPERFKRPLPVFVADALHDTAVKQQANGKLEPVVIERGTALARDAEQPHDVRIKWLRFLAELERESNPEAALELFQEAFALDPKKAKCKTIINQLRKQLKQA